MRSQLEKQENKVGWKLLTTFSILCSLLFFEIDVALSNEIESTSTTCDQLTKKIEKSFSNYTDPQVERDFGLLKDEKQQIDRYHCRKHMYSALASFFYSPLTKTKSLYAVQKEMEKYL